MAIALIVGRDVQDRNRFPDLLGCIPKLIETLQPGLDVRVYPDLGNYQDIDFAMVWRHPFGIFAQLPNLRCIASLGAGVDHLFADPHLPKTIPIVRIVDPAMSTEITQYVVTAVLYWLKRFDHWEKCQHQKFWARAAPFNFLDKTVGIMGLGFLGTHTANTLSALGVKVIGWSQSPKQLSKIQHFSGAAEFKDFLKQTGILVCMLPLTPHTQNILNLDNFNCLPKGAYLINIGRGEHLVENDLLTALDSGQLAGAYLDVFRQEPLPPEHPFWLHQRIRVTPHIAAVTNPATALPQILENYRRLQAGEPLLNCVHTQKGY